MQVHTRFKFLNGEMSVGFGRRRTHRTTQHLFCTAWKLKMLQLVGSSFPGHLNWVIFANPLYCFIFVALFLQLIDFLLSAINSFAAVIIQISPNVGKVLLHHHSCSGRPSLIC